jgi:hypothetical protein
MSLAFVLRHLGGPGAISTWSVLLPLPLLLVLRWITLELRDSDQRWQYLLATVIGQVLVGLGAWAAWRTVLRPVGRGSRAFTTVAVFATLGVLRIAGIAAAEVALGVPLSRPLPQEFVVGAIQGVVVLGVIAVCVDAQREYAATRERLLAVRERIRFAESLDQARVREISRRLLDKVATDVVARIEAAAVSPGGDAHSAARALRGVAEDYVRPLSHRIEEEWASALLPELVTRATAEERRSRAQRLRDALREAASVLQPPSPLALTILMALVATPTLIRVYGTSATGVVLATALPVLLTGAWLVRSVMRRAQGRPVVLVITLVGGALATAGASAAVNALAYQAFTGESATFTATIATFTFLAVGLSVFATAFALLDRHQAELTQSVAADAVAGERIVRRLAHLQRAWTRFLHSSVQGELVATALMLQRSQPGSIDVERAITEVCGRVLESVLASAQDESDATRARVESQLAFWHAAADVDTAVDERCWPLLEDRPDLAEAFSRIASEGLTNAVRHGTGEPITLRADLDGTAIDLRISNAGTLGHALVGTVPRDDPGAGLGLATIARLSTAWSLSADADQVVLRARIDA